MSAVSMVDASWKFEVVELGYRVEDHDPRDGQLGI